MAPLTYLGCTKVLLFSVILFLFVSLCCSEPQFQSKGLSSTSTSVGRKLLGLEAEEEEFEQPLKKKTTKLPKLSSNSNNLSLKNKTKTKTIKSNGNLSTKNQTKLGNKVSSKTATLADTGLKIKKLNSSTTLKTKKLNSTSKLKPLNNSNSMSLDLVKSKNKTTKAITPIKDKGKQSNKVKLDHENESSSSSSSSSSSTEKPNTSNNKKNKKQATPSWIFEDDDDDLVSGLKDLPSKFQQSLLPDFERISTTSKAYITKANKEITKGFKPYVGNKYAPTIAALLSCALVLIPLLLVSLLFNRIKAYFSLQKLLIFIQAYLAIYFSILCLSSLLTGLEPLRFFYGTSQSTYLCLQVLQTLAYMLYLLLLMMYLILVFSTDSGLGSRFLGLAQTILGFAVGLHYYMTVFHRAVLKQPPKTNWKVHGIYATCFFLICFLANADRRKKTYLEEGGEEGKKN